MSTVLFVLLIALYNNVLLYGQTNNDQKQRVDSLTPVDVKDIPYAAVVFCNINKYFCSGTILHADWVLTTAHCLFSMDGEFTEHDNSVTLVAGTDKVNFTKEDVDSGKIQVRQSQKIHIHNDYSWLENFINDLALIKVEAPFSMTSTVSVMPSIAQTVPWIGVGRDHKVQDVENVDFASFPCKGYGYGKVMRGKSSRDDFVLKEQQYEVSKHCHCLERIRSKKSAYNVLGKRNIFICDAVFSYTGLCAGDAGGQLVCGDHDHHCRGVATALFHYREGNSCVERSAEQNECGDSRTLNVFTDLCYFTSWIGTIVPGYQPTDENCIPFNTTSLVIEDI